MWDISVYTAAGIEDHQGLLAEKGIHDSMLESHSMGFLCSTTNVAQILLESVVQSSSVIGQYIQLNHRAVRAHFHR